MSSALMPANAVLPGIASEPVLQGGPFPVSVSENQSHLKAAKICRSIVQGSQKPFKIQPLRIRIE